MNDRDDDCVGLISTRRQLHDGDEDMFLTVRAIDAAAAAAADDDDDNGDTVLSSTTIVYVTMVTRQQHQQPRVIPAQRWYVASQA